MAGITDWIWNSNAQSLFLSPLIGAIMGFILTVLLSPPSGKGNISVKISNTYDNSINYYHRETHHYHIKYGNSGRSEDDTGAVFGIIAILLLFVAVMCWIYINYSVNAIQIGLFLSWTLLCFSISYTLWGYASGWLDGKGWIYRLIGPPLVGVIALLLLNNARKYANFYSQHSAGIRLLDIIKDLANPAILFIEAQAIGIIVTVLSVLVALLVALHYSALGGFVRSDQTDSLRSLIIKKTEFFSGWSWVVMDIFLLGTGWFCISGKAYHYIAP